MKRSMKTSTRSIATWAWLALGLAFVLSAAGCSTGPCQWIRNGFKVGPNYARPPAPVADQWIEGQDPRVQQQAADYSCWWQVFGDPVLDDLVRTAYAQNLPLKVAGMRVLEARAQLGVACGNLFPQQQAMTASFSRSLFSQNAYPFGEFTLPRWAFDTWSGGFDASWELDFWGRFRRAIESADANFNAQIENYDDVLVILQSEVAATYVQLRTLEDRMRLAAKNVELQRETLRIVQDRFDKGIVSELDVAQAHSQLAATESLIPTLQINHRAAENRLCTLLGMPPQDLEARLGGPASIPGAPPEVAVGIPAELLRRRPDVRRAEREAAAQCARIGVAESDFYPQIAITGNIGVQAEVFPDLFDAQSMVGAIGPSVRWNLLNYGRIRNNVLAHDARFGQLVLTYQDTVLRAGEETENAITGFLREQTRVKRLEESSQAATRAVELANLQYTEGVVDFQRVLDSQRALVIQQEALAQSRGNVATNLVAVYKALGGGWQMRCRPCPPMETIPAERPIQPEVIPGAPLPEAPLPLPEATPSLEERHTS